jgi:hypothetical protein
MRTAPTQVARRKDDEVEMIEAGDEDRRPWWVRARAAAGLVALVVVLGVGTAAVVGLAAVALASLLDHALG